MAQSQSIVTDTTAKLNTQLNQQANFPGLSQYLSDHLQYPELANSYGIEGTIKAAVTLSEEGKILSVEIIKHLGLGCDEAVLKMISEMPVWEPTVKNGHPVKQTVILSVRFFLR